MNARRDTILCIGLTPALQRTLFVNGLLTGGVNRAVRRQHAPGGKACNAARTLKCLGHDPLILGLNGGATGAQLAEELDRLEIRHDFVTVAESTRTCTTVIDTQSGSITELVEEAPAPDSNTLETLLGSIQSHTSRTAAAIIAGNLAPGTDVQYYADVIQQLNKNGIPVFIDTSGPAFLAAREAGPLFMKMNHDERTRTDRQDDDSFAAETLGGGTAALLITNGKEPAVLFEKTGTTRFFPPVIDEVNNLGSGDAATAGTVHAWLEGKSMRDAAAYGLACGTANARSEAPGAISKQQADLFYQEMRTA